MLIINERAELIVGGLHSLTVWQSCLQDEGCWHLPSAADPQKLIDMLWVCLIVTAFGLKFFISFSKATSWLIQPSLYSTLVSNVV